jgi:Fanconi anemia group M protein
VKPYVQDVNSERVEVELTTPMKTIKKYLEDSKNRCINKLIGFKILHSPYVTKSQLLKLQQDLARKKTGYGYMAMSLIAEIIKIDHAMLLLETQCIASLNEYFYDMKNDGSKAVARMMKDENFINATRLAGELLKEDKEHPKIEKLGEIIYNELQKNKEARIIVFAQYRSTIKTIFNMLSKIKHAAPAEFIGQAKKKGFGLSQKEQVQILNEFKMGFYNILCASQVAEEGLDVIETDMVIFYEPVPSAIRKIQRSGRTARTKSGRVIIMITKGTRDEVYHWVAHNKEKKMTRILHDMQNKGKTEAYIERQKNLEDFGP